MNPQVAVWMNGFQLFVLYIFESLVPSRKVKTWVNRIDPVAIFAILIKISKAIEFSTIDEWLDATSN